MSIGAIASSYAPASGGLPVAGAARHWDFSDSATVTIATGISQVLDKSGNGAHLAQADTTKQPGYAAASGWGNGLNVAVFDGSNDVLVGTDVAIGCSIFVVCKKPDSASLDALIKVDGHATYLNSGNLNSWDGSSEKTWSSTSTDWTAAHVDTLLMQTGANATQFFIDGVSKGTATFSDSATDGVYIGADSTAGASAGNWMVGEVVIYPTVLGSTDRAAVEAYLKAKWGTP